MYRKRTILLAALAGLGLFICGCRSSCERRPLFDRCRPCCSSPVESGCPCIEEPGCCPGVPVSFGEGPPLGVSAVPPPALTPPPVYTNGVGPPRLVPQPHAQPVPYMP